jgi:hypothetical protein
VRDDWQRRGVGSALLTAALDLADRWLNYRRLELTVYTDNTAAVTLYRKFGFVIEGTHRDFAFRDGRYVDAFAMARLNAVEDGGTGAAASARSRAPKATLRKATKTTRKRLAPAGSRYPWGGGGPRRPPRPSRMYARATNEVMQWQCEWESWVGGAWWGPS